MKTVVILSVLRFQNSPSAGAARTMNYARAMANNNVRIIFASFLEYDSTANLIMDQNNSNIYYYSSLNINKNTRYKNHKKKLFLFFKDLYTQIKDSDKIAFLLYPTSYVTFDLATLVYLKKIKRQRIFCEINEVKKHSVSFRNERIKYNYFKHSLNEFLAKYYDGLICISTNIREYYIKYNNRSILIPILSDMKAVEYDDDKLIYKNGSIFNIGFTGSISIAKENFKVFFEALSKVKKKKYHIVLNLYGRVPIGELSELQLLLEKNGITKYVINHGQVDQNEIDTILRRQQLLVLPRGETLQNKYGFSTKLSEYIVSGVPIMLTDVSDNLKYLKDAKDVILVDAVNSDNIASKLMHLIDNYNEMAPGLAENAIKSARKHFDYMLYKNDLSEFLFKNF